MSKKLLSMPEKIAQAKAKMQRLGIQHVYDRDTYKPAIAYISPEHRKLAIVLPIRKTK